jgi:molybdate transport system permease protein
MVLSEAEILAALLSLKVAFWSSLCLLPVAFALAWVLSRCRFRGRLALDVLIHLPLVLPPVSVGFLLLLLFGARGPLGKLFQDWFGISVIFTWQGAALTASLMSLPLVVNAIRLSLDAIDPKLEAASRSLGAGAAATFVGIVLPLARPGILMGLILGFARSLGEFGATITFVGSLPGETETLSLAVHRLLQMPDGEAGAMRLTILAIAIACLALAASRWFDARLRAGRVR